MCVIYSRRLAEKEGEKEQRAREERRGRACEEPHLSGTIGALSCTVVQYFLAESAQIPYLN